MTFFFFKCGALQNSFIVYVFLSGKAKSFPCSKANYAFLLKTINDTWEKVNLEGVFVVGGYFVLL